MRENKKLFSYFGGKRRIAKKYPNPKHTLIIEPFAGACAYSLLHFEHDVIAIDKSQDIIDLWNWLKQCQPRDILSLPSVKNGEKIPTYLSREEKLLLGFCCNNGSSRPKFTAGRMNFNSWHRDRERIADDLYKIKHWQFYCNDYDKQVRNVTATWFIDPPYVEGGQNYHHNKINYPDLAKWCQNRVGQVIVCENNDADWLPFTPLVEVYGQRKQNKEVIWYNGTIDTE